MSGSQRPDDAFEEGVFTDAKPNCVALVPVVASAQWSHTAGPPRPNSNFLTQLIATAEQVPQTRSLRRATPADAQTAYGPHPVRGAGLRTRQII